VTGTTATTTFVTSTFTPPTGTSPKLLPITTSNNTVGTAITLPSVPNSLLIAPNGGKAFLGSSSGMMVVDMTTNAITTVTNAPGTVISVSQDSAKTVVANGNTAQVIDNNTGGITNLNLVAPASHVSWSPDSYEAYIVAGNNLYVYSANFPLKVITPSSPPNDVAFLISGPFAYVPTAGGEVKTFRTCDNTEVTTGGTFGSPTLVQSLPNAAQVVAADGNGKVDVITPAVTTPTGVNANPCVAITVSNSSTTADFGAGPFTPKQVIVTPDSNFVFVLPAGINKVFRYKVSDGSVASVTLAGGCTEPTSGGVTLDSATLYVGCAGTNDVHVINVAAGTDTVQVATSFQKSDGTAAPPDLVAVRPH
jgi:hypothetical protein